MNRMIDKSQRSFHTYRKKRPLRFFSLSLHDKDLETPDTKDSI